MKKAPIFIMAAILIGGIVCAGCVSTDSAPSETPIILTGSWAMETNPDVTITFYESYAGGKAPVNYYSGKYTANGSTLSFDEGFITTLMAGMDDAMELEKQFFSILGNTATYLITEDGKLLLKDAAGKTMLVFVYVPSIYGDWVGEDGTSITFNADNTYHGHAVINSFGGSYTLEEGKLTFGEDSYVTEMAGSPEDMKKENEFFEALLAADGCKLDGYTLILTGDGKDLLTFERPVA